MNKWVKVAIICMVVLGLAATLYADKNLIHQDMIKHTVLIFNRAGGGWTGKKVYRQGGAVRIWRLLAGWASRSSGCNSVVECQLPKLDVVGSNPITRFFHDNACW